MGMMVDWRDGVQKSVFDSAGWKEVSLSLEHQDCKAENASSASAATAAIAAVPNAHTV